MSRVARCVALFLVPVLAACATASGGQTASAWNQEAPRSGGALGSTHPPQFQLAMSDGPASGGELKGPAVQGYNVPGRKPDSQMPWEFFLGNASHRLIAFMYGVNHPVSRAYYNSKSIKLILDETEVGDSSLLCSDERDIRPDITDVTLWRLFEIKPWNGQALREGREEARKYLAALNRTILVGKRFTGGTDFQGEILVRFAGGQYIWRLEWKTPEPGVVQYKWTRSQQRFESEVDAYEAGQWVDLTVEELRQYGGWVSQAVEGMVSWREKLVTISGAVGMVIDVVGGVATTVLWGSILGQMGAGPGSQQTPAQGGGQVIPFPARPPPTAPPAQVPAAAGMSLPP
ncbi:hypothetical protein DAT35_19960 [Vitiosangium sp. GDMCC 1.1324]|nr:hypothetical protein DAT35_19960 [Vitiosangium sp. GDMCC 1.1324]